MTEVDVMKNEAYIRASSHFLTDEYPADWQDMTEEELLRFIEQNQWESFEYDAVYIWENIENLAQDFISFAKKHNASQLIQPQKL